VLVDNLGALQAELGDGAGLVHLETFQRIAIDGAPVGIHLAITADRSGAVASPIAATSTQRLVLRLADPVDAATIGLRIRTNGTLPPGRGWWVETGLAAQVALPHPDGLSAAVEVVARGAPAARAAVPRVEVLPSEVPIGALSPAVVIDSTAWFLPIGLGDRDLAPVGLHLGPNDHALIAGPARSGKSTILQVIGSLARDAGADVLVLAGPRSLLADRWAVLTEQALEALPEQLAKGGSPWLLLIDDVEAVDDAAGHLRRLLAMRLPNGHVVAAGRPDRIRVAYGSWIQELRESRIGAVLRPNLDIDGDLWQTPLPRRSAAAVTHGRGFLVAAGEAELFQAARP
jgi:S-DNA-T family DNA segregation ATPase FtsK/SpoIIIE